MHLGKLEQNRNICKKDSNGNRQKQRKPTQERHPGTAQRYPGPIPAKNVDKLPAPPSAKLVPIGEDNSSGAKSQPIAEQNEMPIAFFAGMGPGHRCAIPG
jgi:hypothetical protein